MTLEFLSMALPPRNYIHPTVHQPVHPFLSSPYSLLELDELSINVVKLFGFVQPRIHNFNLFYKTACSSPDPACVCKPLDNQCFHQTVPQLDYPSVRPALWNIEHPLFSMFPPTLCIFHSYIYQGMSIQYCI